MGRTTSFLLSKGGLLAAAGIGFQNSADKRIAQAAFEHWSKGRGSLFDLMGRRCHNRDPGHRAPLRHLSKTAFVREIAARFMARFRAPPRPRPIQLWAEGEHVAVMAEADGTRRDGRSYRNDYVFVLEFRRGFVVKAIEFLDMAAFNDVWDRVEPASIGEPSR